MTAGTSSLAPGLYLVSTPIGSARDITLRALDILRDADAIAAEDTRTARKLMEIHGIPVGDRPLIPYHDHNGPRARPRILGLLREGRSVAYVSEAGTPLVADPGYALARAAREDGAAVTGAPGPSAVLAALVLAGLPTDRFLFAGFLPPAAAARRGALVELASVPATLVFYESPKRVLPFVRECLEQLGNREAAVCRELTKRFEEVRRGSLSDLLASVEADPPRGEVVVVIDRDRSVAGEAELETSLRDALRTMSVKDAAATVAGALSLPKRDVYRAALDLSRQEDAE